MERVEGSKRENGVLTWPRPWIFFGPISHLLQRNVIFTILPNEIKSYLQIGKKAKLIFYSLRIIFDPPRIGTEVPMSSANERLSNECSSRIRLHSSDKGGS